MILNGMESLDKKKYIIPVVNLEIVSINSILEKSSSIGEEEDDDGVNWGDNIIW